MTQPDIWHRYYLGEALVILVACFALIALVEVYGMKAFSRLADVATILFAAVVFAGVLGRMIISTIHELTDLWHKRESAADEDAK